MFQNIQNTATDFGRTVVTFSAVETLHSRTIFTVMCLDTTQQIKAAYKQITQYLAEYESGAVALSVTCDAESMDQHARAFLKDLVGANESNNRKDH